MKLALNRLGVGGGSRFYDRVFKLPIGGKVAVTMAFMLSLLALMGAVTYRDARLAARSFEGVRLANERAMTIRDVDRAVVALQRDVQYYTFTSHASGAESVRQRSLALKEELQRIRLLCADAEQVALVVRLEGHLAEHDSTFHQAVEERELRTRLVVDEVPSARRAFFNALRREASATAPDQELSRQRLEQAMGVAEAALFKYLNHPSSKLLTEAQTKLSRAILNYDEALGQAAGDPSSPGTLAGLYLDLFTRIVQATRAYLHLTGVVMAGEAMEFRYVSGELRELITSQVEPLFRQYSQGTRQTQKHILLTWLMALVAAALIGVTWTRNFARPIREISNTFTQLAEGKEAFVPGLERHDEIGQLAKAADFFRQKNAETEALLARAQHLTVELKRHQEELQASNSEMEQFVYTVSHDLKSPVVTTAGFLGMMRRLVAQGRVDEAMGKLDTLERANDRMAELIDDLLDLSRIGRVDVDVSLVDPGEVLESWRGINQSRLEEAQMRLHVEESLPTVAANRSRVLQVFDNLIGNAIKYGRAGEGWGNITVGGQSKAGEAWFFVRDDGSGVAPEFHTRIFGLFNRLSGDSEGTGVGLAIVQRIMQSYGGRVWVESRGDGDGALFWLAFPQQPLSESTPRS